MMDSMDQIDAEMQRRETEEVHYWERRIEDEDQARRQALEVERAAVEWRNYLYDFFRRHCNA